MTEEKQERVPIGEASHRTGLPESTIRYYDREFSDYLSIPRGENNQRLFNRQNMEDLEYIRYLIKRENLSVEDVRRRLHKEASFEGKRPAGQQPRDASPPSTDADGESDESGEHSSPPDDWVDRVEDRLTRLEDRLDKLEEGQQKIRRLLDMNLQRYNQLVDDL